MKRGEVATLTKEVEEVDCCESEEMEQQQARGECSVAANCTLFTKIALF